MAIFCTKEVANYFLHNGIFPPNSKPLPLKTDDYPISIISRRFFIEIEDGDFFKLSKRRCNQSIEVWYCFGYRAVIEYFDTNLVIDIQYPITKTTLKREIVISKLLQKLSQQFSVKLIGDNDIINVQKY